MPEKKTSEEIKKALDNIRPMLQADGGDVQFVSWEPKTGTVEVQLMGMCVGCPMAQVTLKQGIEAEIKKAIPEVKEVIGV
jgi:Fe-S cluster biogenesis protein NfuA